jgi:ABC-type enterochelin transport system permease subunit
MNWKEISALLVLIPALLALVSPFEIGVALLLGSIGLYLFILWY